ncbi:50S ribosomal protein L6 [Candidatus Falkowbacteria bacterium]|jgi:large subunit ribosomal protein L6|nr:50S ribosomal protein L6 [Patescibacteria group bacterium]MDD3434904.1 50S ribosomal protein L6 [Patescibacteria group bacterium]MDD4466458.1 50S ribosomal protein L6 [Patescibacteria group bacterium]NCU43014.1 50S ribosomal protein L6 [Candidatus Falkowbacteria bacterium]
MSRIGKTPIILPSGVTVTLSGNTLTVKGPKGELKRDFNNKEVALIIEDKQILVTKAEGCSRSAAAMWGLYRSLFSNMVIGVSEGFSKKLEVSGVGYRASVSGSKLTLMLGFSHPIEYQLPAGITATVEGNSITVSGFDKELVGETAAKIRRFRKPEPYKGKGIKYANEVIRRKAGKTAAAKK